LVLALSCACAASARVEVGYGTTGWRAGGGIAIGLANGTAQRSISQSIGYRYAGSHSATTTTRVTTAVGPLWMSGAIELDDQGSALVPAIVVPIRQSRSEEPDSGIFPDSDAHLRTVTEIRVIGVGLQPRFGTVENRWAGGVDLVIELDALSGIRD